MTSQPQPIALTDERAFLVRDAARPGCGRATFRHPRWHRPFAGVRSRGPIAATLNGRALQYLPRLRPGERFSHATALALLGCPVRVSQHAPVDVSSPVAVGRVRCRGVAGHRHREIAPEYPCIVPEHDDRIPVSAPLDAVLQSALQLPFCELVVALDFLLLNPSGRYDPHLYVTRDDLKIFAAQASGRGTVRFREAAALARVGAESRMETLMRLGNARVGGPELRLQAELHDGQGCWIGRFDAADDEARAIFEYDGGQHLVSLQQRRRDAVKLQAARDAGWRVRVFFADDVLKSSLATGRRMLHFTGRPERPVRPMLARLLDERSGDRTEPATHTSSPMSRTLMSGHE